MFEENLERHEYIEHLVSDMISFINRYRGLFFEGKIEYFFTVES